jgi:hypothetical protein
MGRIGRTLLFAGAGVIGVTAVAALVGLCPPQGPWPMPPWCGDSESRSIARPVIPIPGRCEPLGGWPTPPEPSPVPIYAKGIGQFLLPDDELAMTATENAWGWNLHLDPCDIELTHHYGARFISEVSLWNHDLWLTVADLPAELADAYVRDLDGAPMTSQGMVFLNLLDPAFRAWLADFIRLQVDLGVDGFVFDETSGTAAAVEQGAGIDRFSIPGFRAWLADNVSSDELRRLGIEDLDAFDYGRWLAERGELDAYRADFSSVPLGWDFYRYHLAEADAAIGELIRTARDHARAQGRELAITANVTFVYNTSPGTRFVGELDMLTFEHSFLNPVWRDGDPWARIDPTLPVGPAIRLADSTGRRTGVLMSLSDYAVLGGLDDRSASTMVAAMLAETYANLGTFVYFDIAEPWDGYEGPDGRAVQLVADRSVLVPYYAFVRRSPLLFNDLQRQARVAVVRPSTVDIEDLGPADNALGYAYALADANVVFDFIDLVDIERHGGYDVVLTGGYHWSDAQLEVLADRVRSGATVIVAADRFAALDLDGRPVERPLATTLQRPGTYPMGAGAFVSLAGSPGWEVHALQDAAAVDAIVGAVTALVDANEAPPNVQVLPYVGDGRFVVHLLNRDGRDGRFNDRRDVVVRVALPDGLDPTGMTLTVDAPGAAGPIELPYEVDGGWLRVEVPELRLWAGLMLTR